jgi:polyhydroxyalkanoate synthesis regulator phasin
MDGTDEDTQAKESAAVVISQLIDQLVKHYKITKSEARMTIREVIMEL